MANILWHKYMTENNHNKDQDRRLDKVELHIETTNKELGQVQTDLAKVKTDVAWLKRTYWVVVSASLGAAVVGIINLLINNS